MKSNLAYDKLENMINVIIAIQIIMTIFNVLFGLWAASQYYSLKASVGGMLIRAVIQVVITLWLINKEKNYPNDLTAWGILVCCLASGFTNIYSSTSSFYFGNIELILIVCSIVLLFRHYSYMYLTKIEAEEKLKNDE